MECVPSYLGGPCRCEHQGGCVAGVGNDVKTVRVLTKDEIKQLTEFGVNREKDFKARLAEWKAEQAKNGGKPATGGAPTPAPTPTDPPAHAQATEDDEWTMVGDHAATGSQSLPSSAAPLPHVAAHSVNAPTSEHSTPISTPPSSAAALPNVDAAPK